MIFIHGLVALFCLEGRADESSAAQCEQQVNEFRSNARVSLEQSCYDYYLSQAQEQNVDYSQDGNQKVFAYKDLIFSYALDFYKEQEQQKVEFLLNAGEQPQIEKVFYTLFDTENNLFSVIANQKRVVKTFVHTEGNVSPVGYVSSRFINPSAIGVDKHSNQLMMIDSDHKRIEFYHRLAREDGRHADTDKEMLRYIEGPDTKIVRPQDICSSKERRQIFLYDSVLHKVLVYNSDFKDPNQSPIFEISISPSFQVLRIKYLSSSDTLLLRAPDGELLEISLP